MLHEVCCEGDFPRLENGDGGGAAKCEVAFFLGFYDGLPWSVGLVNGADAGGTDFENKNGAEIFRFKVADRALVGPEVGEVLRESDRGYGKQRAGDGFCFRRDACGREVVAVVIYRAEA